MAPCLVPRQMHQRYGAIATAGDELGAVGAVHGVIDHVGVAQGEQSPVRPSVPDLGVLVIGSAASRERRKFQFLDRALPGVSLKRRLEGTGLFLFNLVESFSFEIYGVSRTVPLFWAIALASESDLQLG